MGRQVTGGRNQHMRACRGAAQTGILPEGGFDGLYGVEVAVLPEEQAAHNGQEPVSISPAVEVAGDQFSGCVYLCRSSSNSGSSARTSSGATEPLGSGTREGGR